MSIISDKARELLFTGLGILAAFALATAVIFYFRLDAAQARIATQDVQNQQLMEANKANADTISDLTTQVQKANDLAQNMLTVMAKSGEMDARTQEYLDHLVQSNEQIKSLLLTNLPDSVRGLFQSTAKPGKDSGAKGKASAIPVDTGKRISPADK